MMGLWADGWFYISSAGLLISGVLFFFLLGQYRVASEAADAVHEGEAHETPASSQVRPVYIPDEPASAPIASHPAEPKPEPKTEPKPEYAGPERRKDPSVTTGGISPAVVYMQNIKVELAALHEDVRALAKRVDAELGAVSTRDEALIERLTELASAVEALKSGAAAEPAPKKRKEKLPPPTMEVVVEAPPAAAPAPAPVVEAPAPAVPAGSSTPAAAPEAISLELGALVKPAAAPEPAPAPAPAAEPAAPAAAEPPAEEKPRRGPVWPV